MKIVNETNWRTADLRRFASRIANREFDKGSPDRKVITIYFCRARTCIHGDVRWRMNHAAGVLVRATIRVWLPPSTNSRHPDEAGFKAALAMILAHEFLHIITRGSGRSWERNNRKSPRYGYHNAGKYREHYAFVSDWPLEPNPPKVKVRPAADALASKKIEETNKALARWNRKLKLAATKLKKYRKRLRYYEKKLATAALTPPPQS